MSQAFQVVNSVGAAGIADFGGQRAGAAARSRLIVAAAPRRALARGLSLCSGITFGGSADRFAPWAGPAAGGRPQASRRRGPAGI
jgi:hypothetical protein